MSIYLDGTMISVHVRSWTGAMTLKAADLGLTEDEVSTAFKLGRKDLIPAEVMRAFDRLESQARGIVEKNAFSYPEGNFFFLPRARYEKTFAALEECKAEYDRCTADLIANYPRYKEEMRVVYRQAAEMAYVNQLPSGTVEFSIEGHEAEKEEFIKSYLERIERNYPSAESLQKKFELFWNAGFKIAIDTEQTNASTLLRRAQQEEQQHEAELQATATVAAKRAIDIEAYKEQTANRMSGFIDDVVKELRKKTIDICDGIARNIKDGKVQNAKTVNRLKEFIERFKDMNFVGDQVVEQKLDDLKHDFLDVFEASQLREDPELQVELGRRLAMIVGAASEVTDIAEISGQYSRKVAFMREETPEEAAA